MVNANASQRSRTNPAADTPNQDSGPAGTEMASTILAEIVQEIESRGPTGHWLSRASPLVARARLALLNQEYRGATDPAQVEAALRDLVWRVEHVRELISSGETTPDPAALISLLDTKDSRVALACGEPDAMPKTVAGS